MPCPKCNGEMQSGFIPDFSYGSIQASSWYEGEPDKNWMGNVKVKGKSGIPISSQRCAKCGFFGIIRQPLTFVDVMLCAFSQEAMPAAGPNVSSSLLSDASVKRVDAFVAKTVKFTHAQGKADRTIGAKHSMQVSSP